MILIIMYENVCFLKQLTLGLSLMMSTIDFSNSLLYQLPAYLWSKLQILHNHLARVVLELFFFSF